MIRSTLLAFLATTALLSAQDDKAVADIVAKVNATGASLAPVSADAKTYRFTALNVAKEFSDAGLAPLAPIADKITSLDPAGSYDNGSFFVMNQVYGFLLHTAALMGRGFSLRRCPVTNLFEALMFVTWLVCGVQLRPPSTVL